MDRYLIEGGTPLRGKVTAMRSKNATLPILAATLLAESGKSRIRQIPDLRDINTMLQVLGHLGAKIEHDQQNHEVRIDATELTGEEAPYELVRQMRASFLVLGALIGRQQQAKVSLPGGCSLGQRPVDLHLRALAQLGVQIREESGYVVAEGEVKGGSVFFDRPTHTGTENILLAAAISSGKTRIVNAACDPEVVDLARFLCRMGARITGAGTQTIEVEGVKELGPVDYRPMPDRLEVGTLLCMAAATGGELEIEEARPDDLGIVLKKLRDMGCNITESDNSVAISAGQRLHATDFFTYPYPGFPTDLQACFVALSCLAKGTSHIRETIFDDRFSHCMELMRLGARITISGDVATVDGVDSLSGAVVMASDIRAGAGLVTACLAANGTSEVRRIYHIERGYEHLPEKLRAVGASIRKVS
ncbi:MAG: UDP-N-acetylglucosamine 1-carboxyvinyltransferase [candidate division Zixibacteria bacterium]|nr:UDP-N-acetylglucosamine 1-carboxyvinyltransferase [candidate division Zixibacteria bacterium]